VLHYVVYARISAESRSVETSFPYKTQQTQLFHMKKLVTTLFLLLGLSLMAEGSFAQQAAPVGAGISQDALPAHLQGRTIKAGHLPQAAAPLANEEALLYVDLDGENLKYYFVPTTLRYGQSEEEVDTITSLAMRFTSTFPRTSTYLSQISLILGPVQIVNPDDSILVTVHRITEQNGVQYVGSKFAGFDRSIKMADLIVGEPNNVTVDFGGKRIPIPSGQTDFIINFQIPYYFDLPFEEQTFIGIFGDSNEYGGAYDPELHRMIVQGFKYQFSYSGITNSEGPWYANLAVEAIVRDAVADVADENATTFSLHQNYPNPFNPSTEISYSVKETMPVSIKVFNTMGVEVASLVNGMQAKGPHTVKFDASNLPSGSYMYTMTADGETITKAMTLSK
jgi:hypothetical protein